MQCGILVKILEQKKGIRKENDESQRGPWISYNARPMVVS